MTSLSDSQNIDLGPDGSPKLPPGSPLQACPHCDALIDITEREPLEVIQCPGCGTEMAVVAQLANYTITEVAGKGGMGVVYKAYDPALDRLVAIKLLRADRSSDAAIIQQLENEAAITASVNHPNVVRVYNTGIDRNRFFIAMELVDKGSLDDLIRLQGRVAEVQVLEMGIQIARGLHAAYQAGLIHRDVKPGNILFSDAHTSKIVDFGLAIFQEQEESVRGEIWGTPYYVAPEKLDNQPEDFRSDMYSLGATLFHALAGRPPFEAENASLVALKHLKAQQVSLQAFAPWVSNTTAHIINRTLLKSPDQRYQSYDELIENLEFALEELRQHGQARPQRARVVLETEEDQKNWTYLTLGIIGAICVMIVVFFMMRTKMKNDVKQRTAAAAATSSSDESISTSNEPKFAALEKEVDALVSRSADAPTLLRAAVNRSSLSPTDRAWAQFLEGVALLATGESLEARGAFRKVPPLAARVKDEGLGKFLKDAATKLSETEPVEVSETTSLSRKNHEALALLAYGLHDWQLGKVDEGASLLREFRAAKPAGTSAWISSLVPLGNAFMEDLTAFNMKIDRLKNAQQVNERLAAAAELRKLSGPLSKRVEAAIAPYAAELAKLDAVRNAPPAAGLYKVINVKSKKGFDVRSHNREDNAPIMQWGEGTNPNQQWFFTPLGDGLYKLTAAHSGKVLEVASSRTDDEAPIQQYRDNGTLTQKWRIEPAGDGKFKIKSAMSGKVLAVDKGSVDNEAKIVQRTDTGAQEQLWTFPQVGAALGDWTEGDIGNVAKPGSVKIDGDTISFTTASNDLWLNSDSFHYLFRAVRSDFEMVARVKEIQAAADWTKVGIVVRADTTAGSKAVSMVLTAHMGASAQYRSGTNSPTVSSKEANVTVPGWVKVERKGSRLTSSYSQDGKTWTQLGGGDVAGPSGPILFVGLGVAGHEMGKTASAKFDNVRITPLSSTP